MTPDAKPRGLFAWLRNTFIAGLAVIAPGVLTVWLIWNVVTWIDGLVLPLIPERFHTQTLIGWDVPGVGVAVFLIFTLVMGYVTRGFVGRTIVGWGERIVETMPIVRTIYNAVKQIADTILSRTAPTFDRACLIEYPRPGVWALAFISTTARGEVAERLATRLDADEDLVSVFMPTTPNPTTGFLMFLPRSKVIELDMGIEDAAKLMISAGLVYPDPRKPRLPTPAGPDAR
jgi:uncharacterized membrane protein